MPETIKNCVVVLKKDAERAISKVVRIDFQCAFFLSLLSTKGFFSVSDGA